MAARMPSRCGASVRASRTNGLRRERDAQASQASRCAGASAGRRGGRAAAALRAAGRRGRAAGWPAGPRRACELADGLALGRLEQRPAGALDPAAGRRVGALVGVPFVAADLVDGARRRARRRGTGQSRSRPSGSARGSRAGSSPLMSIETARIESLRSPSSSKNACKVALLRPGAHHTIAPVAVVGDAGQVAVTAAVADLVDADADQALEAALVELVGDHARDDPPDRVPADPQQRRRSASWPSAGPATRRRPRSRACAARPAAPTAPAPPARRSRGSAAAAARTRQAAASRPDPDAASACRRSWICSRRPVWPHPAQTSRRRRRRTVTITPSAAELTSITDAPGSPSTLLMRW